MNCFQSLSWPSVTFKIISSLPFYDTLHFQFSSFIVFSLSFSEYSIWILRFGGSWISLFWFSLLRGNLTHFFELIKHYADDSQICISNTSLYARLQTHEANCLLAFSMWMPYQHLKLNTAKTELFMAPPAAPQTFFLLVLILPRQKRGHHVIFLLSHFHSLICHKIIIIIPSKYLMNFSSFPFPNLHSHTLVWTLTIFLLNDNNSFLTDLQLVPLLPVDPWYSL